MLNLAGRELATMSLPALVNKNSFQMFINVECLIDDGIAYSQVLRFEISFSCYQFLLGQYIHRHHFALSFN